MEFQEKDLLLLVWVHGFKGTDVTFEQFPERVCHLLKATHPTLKVESRVFPAYQTRGELKSATEAFVDWLTTLVVQLEVDHGAGGGAGKAKIVLMGHSMGGLLIADAARDIASNTREGEPMWPKIVALCAFDTPYLGLHPHVFKHGISTAAGYYETARTVASTIGFLSPAVLGMGMGRFGSSSSTPSPSASPSGSGSRTPNPEPTKSSTPPPSSAASTTTEKPTTTTSKSWFSSLPALPTATPKTLYSLGAAALGAAAVGTAYYRREDFLNGWKWGAEHMTFVGNLWDSKEMGVRLDAIDTLDKKHNIRFWNYYTHLPANPPSQPVIRTFTILPAPSHPTFHRWIPVSNSLATDEANAHMYMFNGKTNEGFWNMGLAVVGGIGERVEEEGVVRGQRDSGADEKGDGEGMDVDVDEEQNGPDWSKADRKGGDIPGLEGEKGIWG